MNENRRTLKMRNMNNNNNSNYCFGKKTYIDKCVYTAFTHEKKRRPSCNSNSTKKRVLQYSSIRSNGKGKTADIQAAALYLSRCGTGITAAAPLPPRYTGNRQKEEEKDVCVNVCVLLLLLSVIRFAGICVSSNASDYVQRRRRQQRLKRPWRQRQHRFDGAEVHFQQTIRNATKCLYVCRWLHAPSYSQVTRQGKQKKSRKRRANQFSTHAIVFMHRIRMVDLARTHRQRPTKHMTRITFALRPITPI